MIIADYPRLLCAAGFVVLAHAAPGQAVWQDPPPSTSPAGSNGWIATIPFADDGDPLIALAVRIQGRAPRWWILDTGASICLIDSVVATGAGISATGRRQIHGTGNGTVGIDSVPTPLRLAFVGGYETTCHPAARVDLRGLQEVVGRPVAGILGYDFFSRYVVQIDYAAHVLRLYDPDAYRYTGRGDTVPLTLTDHHQALLTIRITDGKFTDTARTLILDTGSGDAVDDSLVLQSTTRPRYSVPTSGLGASYSAVEGTLATVGIGRFVLHRTPSTGPGTELIGNAIWGRFTCIVDYPHHRLFLEPNEHFDAAFDRGPRSGVSFFSAAFRTEPTVSAVNAGSPGAAAGIRAGDVIESLDGQPISHFGVTRLTYLLNRTGNSYRLGVRRGTSHTMVQLRL
jgi:hypothetical protein